MEFDLQKREPEHEQYTNDVLDVAYEFTKLVSKEIGTLLRASVLFGSATHKEDPHDIDILLIIDDIQISFTQELQQAYRIIVENCVRATSTRLHITTLRFSNFWEHVRVADPVVVSVLREGQALVDTGFFAPLQIMLQQGRIRPSKESVWTYYSRAPQLLLASKLKLLHSVVDLYWACIDASHAVLMSAAVVPQAPEHVPALLREHFVEHGLLEEVHVQTVEKFYRLQKDIHNRNTQSLSGARVDALHKEADVYIKKVRTLLE